MRHRLRRIYRDDLGYVIQQARMREAGELSREVMTRRGGSPVPGGARPRPLDLLATHPIWGWPFLAAVLYLAYLFVGVFGA